MPIKEYELEPYTRREFVKKMGMLTGCGILTPPLLDLINERFPFISNAQAAPVSNIYVSKNGNPVTNMQKVIELAGGITNYIEKDDVVLLKPNLQWPKQGYTNTEATKAIIEIILNRPGGFTGEIIVSENVQGRNVDDIERSGWAAGPGDARMNNWADMNYNELIAWFNVQGAENVTSAKIVNGSYPYVSGPSEGHGHVREYYTIENAPDAIGRVVHLPYPIIESSYSGKMIDLKNGIWSGGGYTGQKAKLIFLPTLNYHGGYAGCTSAVKSHLGTVRLANGEGGSYSLHRIGYSSDPGLAQDAVGEAVGHLITAILQPTLYITVAEYAGHRGRTSNTAENAKTIGLCNDPVSLDFWMGKNVIGPLRPDCDPTVENPFRKTLQGCQSKGVGTLNEAEMLVTLYDHDNPVTSRKDIERKINQFKEGATTETEVLNVIENYMTGS